MQTYCVLLRYFCFLVQAKKKACLKKTGFPNETIKKDNEKTLVYDNFR